MDNLADLVVQGVALIINYINFATIKNMLGKAVALVFVIVCGLAFCFNYFSNFAGGLK